MFTMIMKCEMGVVGFLLVYCTVYTDQKSLVVGIEEKSSKKTDDQMLTNFKDTSSKSIDTSGVTKRQLTLSTVIPSKYSTGDLNIDTSGSLTVAVTGSPIVSSTESLSTINTRSRPIDGGDGNDTSQDEEVPCVADENVPGNDQTRSTSRYTTAPPERNDRQFSKIREERNLTQGSIARKILKKKIAGTEYTGVYLIPDMLCSLCARQPERRGRRRKCRKIFCYKSSMTPCPWPQNSTSYMCSIMTCVYYFPRKIYIAVMPRL